MSSADDSGVDAAALRPGDRVLHYVVRERLKAGGMGCVFRAYDERLHKDVVLKFLLPELRHDADSRERFRREAAVAARVQHSNVVTTYSIETVGYDSFIVSQYIPGTDLSECIIRGEHAMPAKLAILEQVAYGLAACHAAEVVHQDITPRNIRITSEGKPVLVDFGLGKRLAVSSDSTTQFDSTYGAAPVGTLPYVSPERLMGQNITSASDVFALGVIGFELLTGERPFWRATPAGTIVAILHDPTPALRQANPSVEERIALTIQRCMSRNPAERPSAREVAEHLEVGTGRFARDLDAQVVGALSSLVVLENESWLSGDMRAGLGLLWNVAKSPLLEQSRSAFVDSALTYFERPKRDGESFPDYWKSYLVALCHLVKGRQALAVVALREALVTANASIENRRSPRPSTSYLSTYDSMDAYRDGHPGGLGIGEIFGALYDIAVHIFSGGGSSSPMTQDELDRMVVKSERTEAFFQAVETVCDRFCGGALRTERSAMEEARAYVRKMSTG